MKKEEENALDNKAIDKEVEKLLQQQEQQELLFNTEAFLKKSPDLELEKHELRNGTQFTIREVKDLIKVIARECEPMFPNSKPFFKLMYKLLGWDNLNPNDFIKPPVVATYIKRYIYGRFHKEVLPTLLNKDNPLIWGYVKKYKLYQFLNDQGLLDLEQYIQEAINVMAISKDWADFEKKYTDLYNLPPIPVQLKLIK